MDLALCSLSGAVSASVVPAVADHKVVVGTTSLLVPKLHVIERTVWVYKKANWEGLVNSLRGFDFSEIIFANCSSFMMFILNYFVLAYIE